jgi:hypothetical protein
MRTICRYDLRLDRIHGDRGGASCSAASRARSGISAPAQARRPAMPSAMAAMRPSRYGLALLAVWHGTGLAAGGRRSAGIGYLAVAALFGAVAGAGLHGMATGTRTGSGYAPLTLAWRNCAAAFHRRSASRLVVSFSLMIACIMVFSFRSH